MENLIAAYALIAVVLIGYSVNLWRRMNAIERERQLYESKN